jgi:hypothetical protein
MPHPASSKPFFIASRSGCAQAAAPEGSPLFSYVHTDDFCERMEVSKVHAQTGGATGTDSAGSHRLCLSQQ